MPYRKRAALILVLAAAYWAVLFVLTHLPLRAPVSIAGIDKLQHATAYAGLAILLYAAAGMFWPASTRVVVRILLLIATYAAFDEVSQGWVRHRSPDLWDWCADMVGASIGIALYSVVRARLRRSRDTAEAG